MIVSTRNTLSYLSIEVRRNSSRPCNTH